MGTVAIAASTTSTSKSGSISTLDVANSAPTVVLASCEIGPQIRWKGRWVEGHSARSASASVGNEDATDILTSSIVRSRRCAKNPVSHRIAPATHTINRSDREMRIPLS